MMASMNEELAAMRWILCSLLSVVAVVHGDELDLRFASRPSCEVTPLMLRVIPPPQSRQRCNATEVLTFGCKGECMSYTQIDNSDSSKISRLCTCCEPLSYGVHLAELPCRGQTRLRTPVKFALECHCRQCQETGLHVEPVHSMRRMITGRDWAGKRSDTRKRSGTAKMQGMREKLRHRSWANRHLKKLLRDDDDANDARKTRQGTISTKGGISNKMQQRNWMTYQVNKLLKNITKKWAAMMKRRKNLISHEDHNDPLKMGGNGSSWGHYDGIMSQRMEVIKRIYQNMNGMENEFEKQYLLPDDYEDEGRYQIPEELEKGHVDRYPNLEETVTYEAGRQKIQLNGDQEESILDPLSTFHIMNGDSDIEKQEKSEWNPDVFYVDDFLDK